MKYNQEIDKKMKAGLDNQVRDIEPSENLFNQIKLNIYEKEKEKVMNTKKFSFKNRKKLLVTELLCIALTSITIIGATLGRSWTGHTTLQYFGVPDKEAVQKDVGFSPKYTEELPGGFTYKMGGTGTAELKDETQNIVTETKMVTFMYERDKENNPIALDVEQIEEQYLDYEGSKLVDIYEGIEIYYYEQISKFVPPDYKPTPEEEKAVEAGELNIGYGASEISIQEFQMLTWYEEGLKYTLGGFDYDFTPEEMVKMAKVVIDKEE